MKKKAPEKIEFPLKIVKFVPRFVPEHMLGALSNMWHISRVPTSSTPISERRYLRLVWTADQFVKEHPELKLSSTAVYKDLCDMVETAR